MKKMTSLKNLPTEDTAPITTAEESPSTDASTVNWLAVVKDEPWLDFVARVRQAPHIQQANNLAKLFTPDKSFTIELQSYLSAERIDKTIKGEQDLPKAISLIGVVQSYREKVSSTQIGLMDMARHLRRAQKECEAWVMLHPAMKTKKEADKKRAAYLVLQELDDTIGDINHLLKAAEAAIWTLKQAADSYGEQKQGITTMIYSGMRTGVNPEHLVTR